MPYLIVAIMALFGLGFVGLLFVAARRGRPYQHDAATATTTLRHGVWLRAFAVFAFFGAELVLCVWLLVNPPPTARLAALPLLGGVVLGLEVHVWQGRVGKVLPVVGLATKRVLLVLYDTWECFSGGLEQEHGQSFNCRDCCCAV